MLKVTAKTEYKLTSSRSKPSDFGQGLRAICCDSEGTYEGWIGILHPENVALDARLNFVDSAHLRL